MSLQHEALASRIIEYVNEENVSPEEHALFVKAAEALRDLSEALTNFVSAVSRFRHEPEDPIIVEMKAARDILCK